VSSDIVGSNSQRTIILPLVSDLAQLGNAVKVGVEVQNVLAVVALAGFDELKVVLLELPDLHDMILGLLELCRVSPIA
jgi:hypothetical protein